MLEPVVSEARPLPRTGRAVTVLLDGKRGSKRVGMRMVEFEEGHATEPHSHRADQVIFTLEGCLTIEAGGVDYSVPAGSAVSIPEGLLHLHKNSGSGRLRTLSIFAPPVESIEGVDGSHV